MSNDLATLGIASTDIVPSKYGDDKAHDSLSSGSYLPRLQLCGSSSNLVKKNKVNQGVFVVTNSKDSIIHNLTNEFNCLVLSWRPKTLRIAGDDTKAYFNPASESFQQIAKLGDSKDSNVKRGNLYGPEYLVYLPVQKCFATFFFMNPTMRRVAGDMKALIGKSPATIASTLIEKGENSWHGPVITPCNTPLQLPGAGTEELAALQLAIKHERDKFNSPPEETAEVVAPEEVTTGTQRAR